MKHLFLALALAFGLSSGVDAQEDDRGYLTRTLEEALGGTGRDVRIEGFRGALTSQASFDSLTIADENGIWLALTDVVLDWRRAALLRGRVEVNALTAKSLKIERLPEAENDAVPTAEASGFSLPELPVSIEIKTFKIDDIALGPTLLGEAVGLKVEASAFFGDGMLETDILAERIDQKLGWFVIKGKFEQAGEALNLDMNIAEEESGIAARLLNLPGEPEIDLSIKGDGLLSDFVAQVELASGGAPRVTGEVELTAEPATPESAKPSRRIQADLSGDIAALLAPRYQPFFGDDIALRLDASLPADGGVKVDKFDLIAQLARLSGQVRLNSDYWPEYVAVEATVKSPDQSLILLPVGGADTRISGMQLSVQYDAAKGERLDGVFDLRDLTRDEIVVDQASVKVGGTLQGDVGSVGQVLVETTLVARGIKLADPDLAAAIGPTLTASANVLYIEDQPVRLTDLVARGDDYGLRGSTIIGALQSGFETQLDIKVEAQDLSRFSGLAGAEIAGAVMIDLAGEVAPLAGTFDLEINGNGDDLSVGQDQVDALLAGRSQVDIAAKRSTTGTDITRLLVSSAALNARGDASVHSGDSQANFEVTLRDVALLAPDYTGALILKGSAIEDSRGWSVDVKADGPYGARAAVSGLVTGPDAAVDVKGGLPDVSVFVPKISGPFSAEGHAEKSPKGWQVAMDAAGPSGTSAKIAGLVRNDGDLDVEVSGAVPLGLSAPFIKPRILQGQASFDLTVRGAAALSSVWGNITTTGASFSAPNLRLALTDIEAKAQLAEGRVLLDSSATVSSGGTVRVSGPMQLSGNLDADLNVTLADVGLVDPSLYETSVGGAISVRGPLLGGANISGQIDVGPTEIQVPSSGLGVIGEIPEIEHIAASQAVTRSRARAGLLDEQPADSNKTSGSIYPLDILVRAPSKIFVRGRGLNAELGGELRLTGTTASMISAGRFDLIRGRLDLLSRRFDLDEGTIQMQGSLVPYLRFVTSTTESDFTATVILEGQADEPKLTFESTPDAPDDEILAYLLFGKSVSDISALQAIQLASAVASLSGRGGIGIVENLRSGIGVDDLDVTTNEEGVTEVKVGKYLTEDIYTDITAGADGDSELSINFDLSTSVRARGSVNNAGDSAVGLFFERDY